MDSQQIVDALRGAAPEGAIDVAPAADGMPSISIAREHVVDVCLALRDRPGLGFAFCADITAVDHLPREPRYEVVLHLVALGVPGYGDTARRLRIKIRLTSADAHMPTLSGVWPAMNWGEREVYDMFGIHFDGHPDLRRILMPDDWEGHPARKDFPVQINMKAKMYEPMQVTAQEFAANLQASRDRAGRDS
jgi:NADH-quinone oxidoreductase subunit C